MAITLAIRAASFRRACYAAATRRLSRRGARRSPSSTRDSYWVAGYFEETHRDPGDKAYALMGYRGFTWRPPTRTRVGNGDGADGIELDRLGNDLLVADYFCMLGNVDFAVLPRIFTL
jgi:hypothetical protein